MPFPTDGLDRIPEGPWPLVESISIKDAGPEHLELHQERLEAARAALALWFRKPTPPRLDLEASLSRALESFLERSGHKGSSPQIKGRIAYGLDGIGQIGFEIYHRPRAERALLLDCGNLTYRFKWQDRSQFKKVCEGLPEGGYPIFHRNGILTDGLSANLVIELDGKLLTPDSPLLAGTMRESLLRAGRLDSVQLSIEDLLRADKVWLINALNPPGSWKLPEIST